MSHMQLPTLADLGLAIYISAAPANTITNSVNELKDFPKLPISAARRKNLSACRTPGNICKADGCSSLKQLKGFCRIHGGVTSCTVDGCSKCDKGGGFCRAHGGGKLCSIDGCNKGVQRYGLCHGHGGTRLCSVTDCKRLDRGPGFCIRHQKEQNVRCSHAT